MSPASIISIRFSRTQWAVAALTAVCSLGLGWYWGGRPEVYWSMERERLHALTGYSQKVRVGSPLMKKAQWCRPGFDGGATFTVYILGYGEGSCCTDDTCGSIGQLIRSKGGATVMIEDIERARPFGVRAVTDERGEHLADRLIVVTDANQTVKGIFRNLDSSDLDAALRYSLRRPPRGPSMLALAMDKLYAWANDGRRRL